MLLHFCCNVADLCQLVQTDDQLINKYAYVQPVVDKLLLLSSGITLLLFLLRELATFNPLPKVGNFTFKVL
jgi:hypothetical protein